MFKLTAPISLTLISRDLRGVLTKPIALAKRSPQLGGFSAFVADHTPAGGLDNGPGFIPQLDMFKLKQYELLEKYISFK